MLPLSMAGWSLSLLLFVCQVAVRVVLSEDSSTTVLPDLTSSSAGARDESSPTTAPTVTPTSGGSGDRDRPCDCDLQVGACEVDCCCDADCSGADIAVFSPCVSRPATSESQCVPPHLSLHSVNLAQHWLHGGLLCVARDNLVVRHAPASQQPVRSLVEFEQLMRSSGNTGYNWQHSSSSSSVLAASDLSSTRAADMYRSGDVLQAVVQGVVTDYVVPWSGFLSSSTCDSVRPVRFLRSARISRCWVPAGGGSSVDEAGGRPSPLLDASLMYRNICLLANMSASDSQSVDNVKCSYQYSTGAVPRYVGIRVWRCAASKSANDHDKCTPPGEDESGSVGRRRRLAVVDDVLSSYHLVMRVSGGSLLSASLFLSVSARSAVSPLSAAVQFVSADSRPPSSSHQPRRSGSTAGYLVGLPLLRAARSSNNTTSKTDGDSSVNVGSVRPLSVLAASVDEAGVCQASASRSVKFGHHVYSACWLRLTDDEQASDCRRRQQVVTRRLMSGVTDAAGGDLSEVMVAATGDWTTTTWLPLLGRLPDAAQMSTDGGSSTSNSCAGLLTHLHWTVLYSSVRHNAVLLGVSVRFTAASSQANSIGRKSQYDWHEDGRSIMLVTTVTFVDVSKPVMPQFARPPRVELRLPADFFYPFTLYSTG